MYRMQKYYPYILHKLLCLRFANALHACWSYVHLMHVPVIRACMLCMHSVHACLHTEHANYPCIVRMRTCLRRMHAFFAYYACKHSLMYLTDANAYMHMHAFMLMHAFARKQDEFIIYIYMHAWCACIRMQYACMRASICKQAYAWMSQHASMRMQRSIPS